MNYFIWAPVWCIIRKVRRKSVLKVGHILSFPLNIIWCTLKNKKTNLNPILYFLKDLINDLFVIWRFVSQTNHNSENILMTSFPLKISWSTLKTERYKRHKQISNESQTMVKSFSRTSFPLNISW